MLVNWGIEAMKWKIMMNDEAPISYQQSLKAIFAGNALAFFTPNRTGEYFGRMLFLEKQSRVKSIPLTIVCSFAQILVTLLAGLAGIIFMRQQLEVWLGLNGEKSVWMNAGIGILMMLIIFLTILYFSLPRRKIKHMFVLEHVNATILLPVLSLSVVRYLVFIVQYFLLFRVFGVNVEWWQAFWSVSVVFLIIAVVPSMGFLSELGVRWQAAIQVIQLYSSNITGIFATSMAVWMINLVIPALVGGTLILALKLFSNKADCNQTGFT
jgi:hypothetical protein